jgi:hypothetical protein
MFWFVEPAHLKFYFLPSSIRSIYLFLLMVFGPFFLLLSLSSWILDPWIFLLWLFHNIQILFMDKMTCYLLFIIWFFPTNDNTKKSVIFWKYSMFNITCKTRWYPNAKLWREKDPFGSCIMFFLTSCYRFFSCSTRYLFQESEQ